MKRWNVHLENPYEFEDVWACGACKEHVNYAKKHKYVVIGR